MVTHYSFTHDTQNIQEEEKENLLASSFYLASRILRGMRLRGQNLRNYDLKKADLTGADLMGANLTGTCLREAILEDVGMMGVKLIGADVSNTTLTNVDLRGSDLKGTFFERSVFIDVDFHDSLHLNEAIWTNASLYSAYFDHMDLSHAQMRYVDIRMATFNHASLIGTDLQYASCAGASFIGADMKKANISHCTGLTSEQLALALHIEHVLVSEEDRENEAIIQAALEIQKQSVTNFIEA